MKLVDPEPQLLYSDVPGKELPKWLWLWFPPVMLGVGLVSQLLGPRFYLRWIEGEHGLLENGTILILVPAIVVGLLAFRARRLFPAQWLGGWILLTTLGCVYFAGEEASWGQHWLGWETPKVVNKINDQRETNLHNVSSWFDQKPRWVLELWVLGGAIIALRTRVKGGARHIAPRWAVWFWPAWVTFPTALLAILIRVPDRMLNGLDAPLPAGFQMRFSEYQEYYFALFLLMYLLSIYSRLRRCR